MTFLTLVHLEIGVLLALKVQEEPLDPEGLLAVLTF